MSFPVPVPAEISDAPALAEMRDRAARWLVARGLAQWNPGEMVAEEFARQATAGELFVVRSRERLCGAVRLIWSDPLIWDDSASVASGYIHGLMVDQHGSGLGEYLLAWAERQITASGRSRARLDCVEGNHQLRSYYRQRGYREVGRWEFADHAWRPVMRLEKHL